MSLIKPDPSINGGNKEVFNLENSKQENFYTGGFNGDKIYYDPLITGFAFIVWTRFPEWVTKYYPDIKSLTQKNFQGFGGLSDIDLTTAATTEGFSANEYHIAQNVGITPNEFTLKHNELSGSPIRNAYTHWVTGIRDPRTGIATYPKQENLEYRAWNHTAELMYIMTRPDADNVQKTIIEFACYWTAVMPKRIPIGHFNYDKATQNAPVDIEIPFSGIFHMSPKVDAAAANMLKTGAHGFDFEELSEYDPKNINPGA